MSTVGSTEQEQSGTQSSKNGNNRQLPYVVNSNSNEDKDSSTDIKSETLNIKVI